MESFIRRGPGETKSGDNDALKYILANMERQVLKERGPKKEGNTTRWLTTKKFDESPNGPLEIICFQVIWMVTVQLDEDEASL